MSSPKWLYSKPAKTVTNQQKEVFVDDYRRNQSRANSANLMARGVKALATTSVMSGHKTVRAQLGMPRTGGTMWSSDPRASPRTNARQEQPDERATIRTKQIETKLVYDDCFGSSPRMFAHVIRGTAHGFRSSLISPS